MSSTTVSLQPRPRGMQKHYFGVVFDAYTPQVEAQMLRDTLALQRVSQNLNRELVIVCESDKPDRMLSGLGCRRVPSPDLTKSWIMYKTGEQWMEEPEDSEVIVGSSEVSNRRKTLAIRYRPNEPIVEVGPSQRYNVIFA